MTAELLDRRALGALEFVDAATGARVCGALAVEAAGLELTVNAGGLHIIRNAAGLEDHTVAFAAMPAAPPAESLPPFTLRVRDPAGLYMARAATLKLPRRAAPASVAGSVLQPVRIALYRQAAAPTGPQWAVLRLRVQSSGDPDAGLANVLVRLTAALTPVPATVTALTDEHGEAVLAVIGAPLLAPADSGGPGLSPSFSASLQLVIDSEFAAFSGSSVLPLPDPEEIERRASAAVPSVRTVDAGVVRLSAGRTTRHVINETLR